MKAITHTTIAAMRRHPNFAAAKAGDGAAAVALVRDLTDARKVRALAAAHPGAILVPVLAVERTGVNAIPLAYVKYAAHITGLAVEMGILQTNRTHHTDAGAIHRLLARPEFDGAPRPGARYIVADDVITTGSTVQALRLFLERWGGEVVAFTALAGSFSPLSGSSLQVTITEDTRHAIEAKFGFAAFARLLRELAVADAPAELTNSQARYLLAFGSLDAIRNRLASPAGRYHLEGHRQGPQAQLTLALA